MAADELAQAPGAASLIVDLLGVAEALRSFHMEYFQLRLEQDSRIGPAVMKLQNLKSLSLTGIGDPTLRIIESMKANLSILRLSFRTVLYSVRANPATVPTLFRALARHKDYVLTLELDLDRGFHQDPQLPVYTSLSEPLNQQLLSSTMLYRFVRHLAIGGVHAEAIHNFVQHCPALSTLSVHDFPEVAEGQDNNINDLEIAASAGPSAPPLLRGVQFLSNGSHFSQITKRLGTLDRLVQISNWIDLRAPPPVAQQQAATLVGQDVASLVIRDINPIRLHLGFALDTWHQVTNEVADALRAVAQKSRPLRMLELCLSQVKEGEVMSPETLAETLAELSDLRSLRLIFPAEMPYSFEPPDQVVKLTQLLRRDELE
ncbi:hypothetical protein BV20DRAFT_962958 [Pilatotrama ljubarskyi]|nr:hypothetical protein BV20DRAFT_962958 [Pilatotrama ljubarskyi]